MWLCKYLFVKSRHLMLLQKGHDALAVVIPHGDDNSLSYSIDCHLMESIVGVEYVFVARS